MFASTVEDNLQVVRCKFEWRGAAKAAGYRWDAGRRAWVKPVDEAEVPRRAQEINLVQEQKTEAPASTIDEIRQETAELRRITAELNERIAKLEALLSGR